MLKAIKILFFLMLIFGSLQAQRSLEEFKISDCNGSIGITRAGDYKIRFTGRSGVVNDLEAYPSLVGKLEESNSIWADFEAPFDGTFYIDLAAEEFLKLVIFKTESSDFCGKIHKGTAEIERLIATDSLNAVGLSKERKKGYLFPIELRKNEEIFFVVNTSFEGITDLKLNIKFVPKNVQEISADMKKVVDLTRDPTHPVFRVALRDANTGLPVKGQVIIEDSRQDDALYFGTDFLYSANKRGSYNFKIDAPGYFFYDRAEEVDGEEDKNMVVWLQPADVGNKLNLKGIQFQMGSTNFFSGAEVQLKRLRDFLHLNPEIIIEIQGHVHSDGSNSFAAKRMSVARAKKVKKYLIDNGIDRKRLKTQGFGDEKMIYPEAKLTKEEQANRRVEIEIIGKDYD